MTLRATIHFQNGPFGWSESYYRSGDDPEAKGLVTLMAKFTNKRASLLGKGAIITGYRLSNVDSQRDSFVDNQSRGAAGSASHEVPPAVDDTADMPWSGLLLRLQSGRTRRNFVFFRGVPDSVLGGTPPGYISTKGDWAAARTRWHDELEDNGWLIRVVMRPPDVPTGAIASYSVGSGGNLKVTTSLPHPLATNDLVSITKGSLGAPSAYTLPKGRFRVANIDSTHFLLQKSGKAYRGMATDGSDLHYTEGSSVYTKVAYDYVGITTSTFQRPAERKPGRPFGSPAGRKRART